MNIGIRILVVGFLLLLIDWYFYQAVVVVFKGSSSSKRNLIFYFYWGFTILSFLLFLVPSIIRFSDLPRFFRVYVFSFVLIVLISKLIGSTFILIDDILRFFRWVISFFIEPKPTNYINSFENSNSISRLQFLNAIALGMAALPFIGFIYGMIKGAFDYRVHKEKITLPNLPFAFNGMKIVQISDIHSGSFVSPVHLEEAVKIILKQNPDIIFFTGDLVNDRAIETEPFLETFKKIKAPMGVYSTLGNHDYGDYTTWDSPKAKANNLERLKEVHSQLGWRLLMNEHIALEMEGQEIALIGIENWGGNLNFPKYGDLKKAHSGTEKYPVKLLLSHDPSHWDKQVKEEYKDIDLTFSGHTHGFQFGIEIPGFRWSPSQYFYKQWAGLYKQESQYLYVNRGLGFLGYPGRLGILPEITVVELYNC